MQVRVHMGGEVEGESDSDGDGTPDCHEPTYVAEVYTTMCQLECECSTCGATPEICDNARCNLECPVGYIATVNSQQAILSTTYIDQHRVLASKTAMLSTNVTNATATCIKIQDLGPNKYDITASSDCQRGSPGSARMVCAHGYRLVITGSNANLNECILTSLNEALCEKPATSTSADRTWTATCVRY